MPCKAGGASAMSNRKVELSRVRHSSLEMADPEVVVKKKQDMLSKARNKLLNLSEALKSGDHRRTIDYFFRHCPSKEAKHQVYANANVHSKKSALQKQNSVGAYPIKIEITEDSEDELRTINRSRPATVCVDTVSEARETAALALERPRKKLSFREPEITGYAVNKGRGRKKVEKKTLTPELRRSASCSNGILRSPSCDEFDFEDESQAMRVVRTIGQAFEVCHKLSITAPENDALDQDEQDTLTQDLLSDRLSDITSDKPKRDVISECDKLSLPPDDSSVKDSFLDTKSIKAHQLDILPPPPTNNTRKAHLTSAETYSSPHSDVLTSGSGGSNSMPPPGSALSAHHEIQLMREQLEQQNQQTQAAVAQLQLAREQLAAEQSARMEAQARTHQLLIQNRELLDHISALVAHLQGGEKPGQQTPAHVTMPQQAGSGDYVPEPHSDPNSLENSPVLQALGLNPQGLIENRSVTSCLPSSPLRTSYNPTGSVFNFAYPPASETSSSLDAQLLQRLHNLGGYPPSFYNYNQPLFPGLYNQPLLNNNYAMAPPPPPQVGSSPMMMRHSFTGGSELRLSPGRNSEPRQQAPQYQSQQNLYQYQPNHLQVRQTTPRPQGAAQEARDSQFIKPLGTLTATDPEGRVRVLVPNSSEEAGNMMANLRLNDELRTLNGAPITRSTSEKVPNRSELMSQVQRTMWARHTTK